MCAIYNLTWREINENAAVVIIEQFITRGQVSLVHDGVIEHARWGYCTSTPL